MSLTYTPHIQENLRLPHFELPSVDGKIWSSNLIPQNIPVLIMFICNHCPYVKAIEGRLIQLGHKWPPDQLQILAVCSNDSTDHPEDHPSQLLVRAKKMNYPFPYLVDEDQSFAQKLGAVCTPDFFLFDNKKTLVYRGRLDDSWKNESLVQNQELDLAIQETRLGHTISRPQFPSMGCSIKWKT